MSDLIARNERLLRGDVRRYEGDFREVAEGDTTDDELAAIANAEHRAIAQAMVDVRERAIRCGQALLALWERVPQGQWSVWVDDHFDGSQTLARFYMRIATYQHIVRGGPEHTSIATMLRDLKGLPAFDGGRMSVGAPPEVRQEAARLYEGGMPYTAIGEHLGVSGVTVRKWVDPDYRRRANESTDRSRRKAREARKALERQERDRAVDRAIRKRAPDSEVLSLIRRAMQRAHANSQSADDARRAALDATYKHLGEAEQVLLGLILGGS